PHVASSLVLAPAPALVRHSFPTRRSSDLLAFVFRLAAPVQPSSPGNLPSIRNPHEVHLRLLRLQSRRQTRLRRTRHRAGQAHRQDRKSTRLNSSHVKISYAVFCLKKKRNT